MAEPKELRGGSQPGLGMRLHKRVLSELKRLNIVARPAVSIVFQQKQRRWMIAGEEGGGSADNIGHYVGYAGVAPDGLIVSIPIQSLIPNATQRRVIAHDLVRVEAFRYARSCNIAVTRHYLVSPGEGRRPELRGSELFRAYNGILTPDTKQPVFFDRAGEAVDLPAELIPAIQAASRGVSTVRNKRAHFITIQALNLAPIELIKSESEPVVAVPQTPVAVPVMTSEPVNAARGRSRSAAQSAAQPEIDVVA